MLDTEGQGEQQQTEDVHPGTGVARVTNRVSLQPSASTVPLNSPRPASSIYSRSVNVYHHGRSIMAATEEKGPNRLDGLIHPAMRRTAQSISSLTSFTAMLRRLPSDDDLQRRQQQQQQQQRTNSASVDDSGCETCVWSELHQYPHHNSDTEQRGPTPSSAALSKRRTRRCSFSTFSYIFISVAVLVILVMCVCIALDVFRPDDEHKATVYSEQPPNFSIRSPFTSTRLVNGSSSSVARDTVTSAEPRSGVKCTVSPRRATSWKTVFMENLIERY